MTKKSVPGELVVAKLSIEAASIALGVLFEKIESAPRSDKVIASTPVQEAITRLKAALTLLADLESTVLEADDPT
jgi:hypothetical protein